MSRRRCCCGAAGGSFRVKNACSPFAVVSGVTVSVYDKDTGALLESGTTDGSGLWTPTTLTPGAQYKVGVFKIGCAAKVPELITFTGVIDVPIWCSTGRIIVTVGACCGTARSGATVTVSLGGVVQGSYTTGSDGVAYLPKTGVGTVTISVPAANGCNATSVTRTYDAAAQCTDSTVGVLRTLNTNWVCCAGRPLPKTLYASNGLGIATLTYGSLGSGSGWSGSVAGTLDHCDDDFVTEIIGITTRSATPPCTTDEAGCRNTVDQATRRYRDEHSGAVRIYYEVRCDSLTGQLEVQAFWLYKRTMLYDLFTTAWWCRECQDGGGNWAPQVNPALGGSCSGQPVVGNVHASWDGSSCVNTEPDQGRRCATTYRSGTPTGTEALTLDTGTSAGVATGDPGAGGTVALALTLTPKSTATWLIEGSPVANGVPLICGNLGAYATPPPPGGASVFLSS